MTLGALAAIAWLTPLAAAQNGPCLFGKPECTEKAAVGGGHITVYRSHSLAAGTHARVERAYVMVHGVGRNADEYFSWALASTVAAGQLDRTVVVAPHFKSRTREGHGDAVEAGEWFWSGNSWSAGEAAANSEPAALASSFDAMDRILDELNDAGRFPALKEIVVAGHSAGGQYAQRYAAANQAEPKMRVPVRYVVANPSSYVYLNELRLRQGAACNEKGECTGPFVKYGDAENCTTYNNYRYGFDNLTGYAARTGAEAMRAQFPKRKVTYLVGELDTRLDDSSLDRSCPANAQGAQRRERGTNFWNYMQSQFSAAHRFDIAPGCGHAAVCVFAGPAGLRAVFGEGGR